MLFAQSSTPPPSKGASRVPTNGAQPFERRSTSRPLSCPRALPAECCRVPGSAENNRLRFMLYSGLSYGITLLCCLMPCHILAISYFYTMKVIMFSEPGNECEISSDSVMRDPDVKQSKRPIDWSINVSVCFSNEELYVH